MTKSVTFPCLLGLLLSGAVLAADIDGKAPPQTMKRSEMTTEQRETMAKAHEQAAECLRSGKNADECHEGIRTACKDELGDQCPQFPMMGDGKGIGMKHGMRGQQKDASK